MGFLFKVIVMASLASQSIESARLPRLSIAESSSSGYYAPPSGQYISRIDGQAGTYSFNYDVSDDRTGNNQYRSEDRYPNGTVTGAYGYVDPFGAPRRFRYVADQAGYRVYQENRFQPFYGYPSSPKPIDKNAIEPTEASVTWSRPKRPNKNKPVLNKVVQQYNGNRRYNLIGPPSLYVPYY